MNRLHKFLNLQRTDRRLLVKSLFLVTLIRLGLWLFPFRILQRLLERASQIRVGLQDRDLAVASKVPWAVVTVSRYVPKATCLTQALAVKIFLDHYGQPVYLRIGVTNTETGQLKAHAWVECQKQIVIGGLEDLSQYTQLL